MRYDRRPSGPQDPPILPPTLAGKMADGMSMASGLALLAAIGVAWAALASWSSLDPSFTRIATEAPRNWLGSPGAHASDAVLQALGLAAFALLFAPMFWAIALTLGERVRWARSLILFPVGVACLATAVAAAGPLPNWPLPYGLGGILGDRLLSALASPLVGPLGEMARMVAAAFAGMLGCALTLAASGVERSRGRKRTDARRTAEPRFDDAVLTSRPTRSRDSDTRRWGPDMLADASTQGRKSPANVSAWSTLDDPLEPYSATGTQSAPAAGRSDGVPPAHGADYRTSAPSSRVRAQYGPYAFTVQSSGPVDPIDTEFDDWTNASSSGMAARFAPPPREEDNGPRAMQDVLTTAFSGLRGTRGGPASRTDRNRVSEGYRRPSLNLLARPAPQRQPSAYAQSLIRGNGRLIADALAEYGITGTLRTVEYGPVVTVFVFEVQAGTMLSRVIALADDIARHLAAPSLRVVERHGGLVAIELPNADRAPISLRECLDSEPYRSSLDPLTLALGRATNGEPVASALTQLPALLVAGGEGASKTTGLNAMILSLIYRHGPEECRFLLIDAGMVDFAVYDGLPHLLTPVVGDPHKAITALGWCVREMEERVKRMAALGVRNIELFNNRVRNAKKRGEPLQRTVQTGFDERTGRARYEKEEMVLEPMPYIVIVVEELADLMAVAGRDIEGAVSRLAKAARSVGIHLIVATDRPTADIVTAPLRASLPARLCYKAANRAESRSVLGHEGAEQLLAGGDSLFLTGTGDPIRLHGPMVSAEEVASVAVSLKDRATPNYVPELLAASAPSSPPAAADASALASGAASPFASETAGEATAKLSPSNPMDELFERAVAIAVRDGGAAIGHLQGTLKINAAWAAHLLARLEAEGVIGKADSRGVHRLVHGRVA